MTTKLGSILVLLSACAANVNDDTPGGGGDDAPTDDGGPGAGNDTVRFRLSAFHDERGDQIDFATGEPVHAHAGPTIQLGGTDCPDVYKYAYLMDATPPRFGEETTPNPLAWKIEAKGDAEYRVRRGDDAIVTDWTPVDGTTLALHRDTITSGKYLLDVRVGDAVATTCWIHHPLAAPVEQQPAQPDPTGLAGMTFAAASPISQLLDARGVRVYSQRFVHHTAEPLAFAIDVAQPTAAYHRRAVDEFVAARTGSVNILCYRDSDGFSSGDPLCVTTNPVPPAIGYLNAGALTTGTWTLRVIDEATNAAATNCAVSNLRATCDLPARAPTGAAQAYRIELALRDATELAPPTAGPFGEHTLAGRPFTGRVLESTQRCAQFVEETKFGVTIVSCKSFTEFTRIQALDQARIAFDPIAITFSASPSPALPLAPLAPNAIAPFTWDAGDADLPGPQ